MLNAGQLRHRITIQQQINTKDSDGNDIVSWQDLYTGVPAAKKPLGVGQFIAAKATKSEIRGRFIIRFAPNLDGTQRVIENGKIYDIHGWLEDPESGREYLSGPYSEGVNEGGF